MRDCLNRHARLHAGAGQRASGAHRPVRKAQDVCADGGAAEGLPDGAGGLRKRSAEQVRAGEVVRQQVIQPGAEQSGESVGRRPPGAGQRGSANN